VPKLLAVFTPNKAVSKRVMYAIVIAQAALCLCLWAFWSSRAIPKPLEVLNAFKRLWMEDGLKDELWTSLKLNLEAMAVSTAISLGLAYLTVLPVMRPIVNALSKGRFLGFVGLTFVFTLYARGGHQLKLALLVFGMSVFFLTSMADVVADIPKEKFDHARTLRMGKWRIVWEVVIRGSVDKAFETLRQNAAMGWMMLTMVEGLVRSEGGIGAMLLDQNKHFKLDAVFAINILILIIGLLQDYVIGALRGLCCPYADLKKERE